LGVGELPGLGALALVKGTHPRGGLLQRLALRWRELAERRFEARTRQHQFVHGASRGAVELSRVLEQRRVTARAHVRDDGARGGLDRVVLGGLVARERLELAVERGVLRR